MTAKGLALATLLSEIAAYEGERDMELSDERLDAIYAAAAKATPGPWAYRPYRYDDWGAVRGGIPDQDGWILHVARSAPGRSVDRKEEDAHRENGTDPYGPNGQHIANCDPQTIMALIDMVRQLRK